MWMPGPDRFRHYGLCHGGAGRTVQGDAAARDPFRPHRLPDGSCEVLSSDTLAVGDLVEMRTAPSQTWTRLSLSGIPFLVHSQLTGVFQLFDSGWMPWQPVSRCFGCPGIGR